MAKFQTIQKRINAIEKTHNVVNRGGLIELAERTYNIDIPRRGSLEGQVGFALRALTEKWRAAYDANKETE